MVVLVIALVVVLVIALVVVLVIALVVALEAFSQVTRHQCVAIHLLSDRLE